LGKLSAQWRSLVAMATVIVVLHVVGFGVLLGFVTPQHLPLGGEFPVFTVGVGLLAYTLGVRHAFDVDHIAAVDNTIRKLMADAPERRPVSVGFWFSLGHSTVVFALALLLALGVKALAGPVSDDSSTLHMITSVVGPSVSGVFLWILALLNLVALVGIVRAVRRIRAGHDAGLEKHLANHGVVNRLVGGLTKSVRKPWHIYPVGLLFGLGFDTATEVGLLVLAGGAAAFDLPFYAILVLPILFVAGMCLMDTTVGVFMNSAYGWAFENPLRKGFYNITVTGISVVVAMIIGSVQLASVAGVEVPLDNAGYILCGIFVALWLAAVAVWRVGAFGKDSASVVSEPSPSTS
jgi:high-affinity nickel-transport protein